MSPINKESEITNKFVNLKLEQNRKIELNKNKKQKTQMTKKDLEIIRKSTQIEEKVK